MIGLDIRAFPVDHGIPCYGFRMKLPRKGAFDPEKAKALKVPMKSWKALQEGESVRVGLHSVKPEQVLGPDRKGISLVFSTDTRPCETLYKYTAGVDLAILEGMYAEEEKEPMARRNRHMLFREAAEIAREAGAERLVLTHFSTSLEEPEEGLISAEAVFPGTVAGKDGMTMRLKYPAGREPAAMEISRIEDW